MKRKLLLGLCVSAAAMGLAGCNKDEKKEEPKPEEKKEEKVETKNLNCSLVEDDDTIRYTLNYTGDNYTKATVSVSTKYKDEKTAKEQYAKRQEEIKEYNKASGAMSSTSISNTLVNSSITFTLEKMDDKAKEIYEESGLKELDGKKYDDAKSTLESAGWSCK